MKHPLSIRIPAGPMLLCAMLGSVGPLHAQVPADHCDELGPANEYPVAQPCQAVPMFTTGMTQGVVPSGCNGAYVDDAWAWFTAVSELTEVTFTMTGCSGLLCEVFAAPVMHVFAGLDCSSMVPVACHLGDVGIGSVATVTISTEPGAAYRVRVQRMTSNEDMEGTLCITPLSAAPENDECVNAIAVGEGTHPFSTLGASGTGTSPCGMGDTRDIWFAYTATCDQQLRVTTCDDANFDTTVSIHDACGGNVLSCQDDHYGCANYTSTAVLNAPVPGHTYLIRIAGFEGSAGVGNVTITCGPPPPPASNDDCANALAIGDGIHPFNVESATGSITSSCSATDPNDVWFAYTASCTGLAMVSTCGTAYFNTTLSVFDGCDGNEIACSNDYTDCLYFTSATTFSTVEGQEYLIRVAGHNGEEGNGEIVIACSAVTWYSRGSGNLSDPIWSHLPNGTPGPAIFSPTMNVVVQAGHTVEQDVAELEAMSFIVDEGGVFTMGEGRSLSLTANCVANGLLDVNGGQLVLNGTAAQIIMGGSTLDLHDLVVNTPGTVLVQTALRVHGTLLLNAGTFNTTGASVTLVSDALRTARLGPVGGTAEFVGDLTVQRWIPGGVTNWRLLGSPVSGATVNDWKDDFFTAGFPGSHYPPFHHDGQLWPSVRIYNEAHPGADPLDGLMGVPHSSTPLAMGLGFAAWSGDALNGTSAFTVDLTGAPHIAHTPIPLPMSWTDTGAPEADGWNLVCNPLPSPIRFSQLQRGADVDNAYHLFDPVSGNFATWNGMVGTLGATDTIHAFQGFFLKANGPDHATTVQESAKVMAPQGGHFGGSLSAGVPMLRLRMSSDMNNFRDEAVVVFADGQPGFDSGEGDVAQLPFAHPEAPGIATRAADGTALTINMFGRPSGGLLIPVMVRAGISGTYTITASGIEHLNGLSCLVLEDLLTGEHTPLHEGATYTFHVEADAPVGQPRMLIHASSMIEATVQHVSCADGTNGAIIVDNTGGPPVDLVWTDPDGMLVATAEAVTGPFSLVGLAPGLYQMTVHGLACPHMAATFLVQAPGAIEADVTMTPTSCANTNDGQLVLDVRGGSAPYSLSWSDGSSDDVLTAGAGSYGVTITDANGCVQQLNRLEISAAPVMGGTIEAPDHAPHQAPVVFHSTVPAEVDHLWDFGDGQTSTARTTVHTYHAPGMYVVRLELHDGTCTHQLEHVIAVGGATGIISRAEADMRAWSAEGWMVLEGDVRQPAIVEVSDATGRVVHRDQLRPGTGTLRIATHGWSAGLYFMRVHLPDRDRAFPLPVAR